MTTNIKQLHFQVNAEKGKVSALYARPRGATCLLVLGHGAGTHMQHLFMEELSAALNQNGIATFRFNYPYSEKGGGMDGEQVRLTTVRNAIITAQKHGRGLSLFAGGHSMSGRMISMAEAEEASGILKGIVFFAFPLHTNQPNTVRAEHLKRLTLPMLFLSGQRDKMADSTLLTSVVKTLGKKASLHIVDTADHGFKVLKRRQSTEPVMAELGRVSSQWLDKIVKNTEN